MFKELKVYSQFNNGVKIMYLLDLQACLVSKGQTCNENIIQCALFSINVYRIVVFKYSQELFSL